MRNKKVQEELTEMDRNQVLNINTNLKNIWVDTLHIAIRDDEVVAVKLSADLPEGQFEQIRFMTSRKRLELFVDIICDTLKYNPKPLTETEHEK